MAKATTSYRCSTCGAATAKWHGRCPKCGESTLVEHAVAPRLSGLRSTGHGDAPARPARRVTDVVTGAPVRRTSTGIGEFDRVIGGGLVAGQVCLCSGPPGSGKSTLLLAVADSVARRLDRAVLYVSGEESVEQLAVRAQRIGADCPNLLLADDTDLGAVLGHLDAHGSELALAVIDSVQTIASADVEGRAGGVTQTMEVASVLTRVAKSRGLPMLLVGQVTKDSTVAGPRALEHIVDTTLSLDGDRHTSLRILRAVKNRFGSLEVAAFEQTDTGLREVLDPSSLFREQRDAPVPGTCVTVTVEGHRALLAEIQALVAKTGNPNPRRGVSGLDSGRSAMLIAISERALKLRLFDQDVFLATVAGMRVSDPATDLAVCLAIISAANERAMPLDMLAIGEVTLSGDVRAAPMMSERVAEALRLGYHRLLVPVGTRTRLGQAVAASRLVEVASLAEAMLALKTPPEPTGPTSTPKVTLRPVPSEPG